MRRAALDVYRALVTTGTERTDPAPPEHRFRAMGETALFEALAQRFLGPIVRTVEGISR